MFQSPSHRGGGASRRLLSADLLRGDPSFNPLLIGAEAPPQRNRPADFGSSTVSIPFSSGRRRLRFRALWVALLSLSCFNPLLIRAEAPPTFAHSSSVSLRSVSIPFSSGRRRLRHRLRAGQEIGLLCFNPLLIGAEAPPEILPFQTTTTRMVCF